jgi:hypothetical protein
MNATRNLLKLSIAISGAAFALCIGTASAQAEPKSTTNWNASSFGAACAASPKCGGAPSNNGQGYDGVIDNGGTQTTVQCSSSRCVYSTGSSGGGTGGGGSPARVAPRDKAHGTGVGLGGILMGQTSPATPRGAAGPRTPKVDTVFAPGNPKPPKIDVKPVRIDTPKVSVPAVGKSAKAGR